MALTRKLLSAMGIEAEKIEEIITAHTETVNGLKETLDQYKADSVKLTEVTKERDKYKTLAESTDGNGYEDKYNTLKAEYDNFKADVQARETKAKQDSAYTAILKECGIAEKYVGSILKISDVSSIEFAGDGSVKNKQQIADNIKSLYADFIVTETKSGADVAQPPANMTGNSFDSLPLDKKMTYANEHPNDEQVKAWLGK
ncbi:MAG: hypothetical protein IJ642_14035 [Oscillospiraceae bacterium]|nr:hypothetical protein [Oscillospiraceae bacterium]MBR1530399.1 hypothetical protein [Oscillospiraceae bacterium]